MIVGFPQLIDYGAFYQFVLNKLILFQTDQSDNELIIDFTQSLHITPSVICDLLCYLNLLTQNENKSVHLMFGKSQHLVSYLKDTQFFLCLSRTKGISSDLLSLTSSHDDSRKYMNTNRINVLSIPPYSYPDRINPKRSLPIYVMHQITQSILMICKEGKASNMSQYNLNVPWTLSDGFIQIIENSYSYAYSSSADEESSCYYTFQNYQKTGIHFANSDWGGGFYKSYIKRCINYKKHKDNTQMKDIDSPILVSLEEFEAMKPDIMHLTAMLESLILRISSGDDFGFRFIFNTLVLPCDGKLVVHSDNVLMEIDTSFLQDFCILENGKLTGYNKDKLRGIIYSDSIRRDLERQRKLRFYNYSFPGVHMSVRIGWEKK